LFFEAYRRQNGKIMLQDTKNAPVNQKKKTTSLPFSFKVLVEDRGIEPLTLSLPAMLSHFG
jgi:hypothetical protein